MGIWFNFKVSWLNFHVRVQLFLAHTYFPDAYTVHLAYSSHSIKIWTSVFFILQAIEVRFWEQVLVKMHFSSNDHRDLCWQILGLQFRIRKKKQKWRDQRWISQFSCLSLSILCHKSPIRSCPHYGVWFDRVNTKTRINEQLFSEVSGKGIKLRKKKRGELDCDFWDHLIAVIQGVP